MLSRKLTRSLICVLSGFLLLYGCSNRPFSEEEIRGRNFFTSFVEEPKYLDPAKSYSADEYELIGQIYEQLFQYHFLKRPLELIPSLAMTKIKPQPLPGGGEVYRFSIRQDAFFRDHPAFARSGGGDYFYHGPGKSLAIDREDLSAYAHLATRRMNAGDFVYQIKRLAHPLVECPIFPLLAQYIEGFAEFSARVGAEVEKVRRERRAKGGAFYNQQADEKENPIFIDLRRFEMSGVKQINEFTLEIRLKRSYPQFLYWLAMPFFSPLPWEADRFYAEPEAADLNLNFDRSPVGTGAFYLDEYRANHRIVLKKNPRYHREYYPKEGGEGDEQKGLLVDAGKKLPMIDAVYMYQEKESIPRWLKFLQGYYDTSGIDSHVFDAAISVSPAGAGVTEAMKAKGIGLLSDVFPSIYYYSFNMLDDVVGGYSEKKKYLRQAISIAFDVEEYVEIFINGRGIPAMGPVPPGIFGRVDGRAGINPVVYRWDEKTSQAKRRDISEAKRLLALAGYPDGRKPDGKPLLLYYDAVTSGAGGNDILNWLRKQFAKLNIQLQIRATDYNQFRDKVQKGNFQILGWGWNADYPDPENFLFLLFGPNAKVKSQGENTANYDNPKVNELFRRMENMPNSPERAKIIAEMTEIIREDAPWLFGFHPIGFSLTHAWYKNAKPMPIGNNTLKYKRIDEKLRLQKQREWNGVSPWVALLILPLLFLARAMHRGMKRRLGEA